MEVEKNEKSTVAPKFLKFYVLLFSLVLLQQLSDEGLYYFLKFLLWVKKMISNACCV